MTQFIGNKQRNQTNGAKYKIFLIAIILTCTLIASIPLRKNRLMALPRSGAITNKEIVRNGDFTQGNNGWATTSNTVAGDGYGKNNSGMGMQIQPDFGNDYGYTHQELYLPAQMTAAALTFDYQFLPQSGAVLGWFRARITTDTADLAAPLLVDNSNYPGGGWQTVSYTLTGSELSAVNAAHAAGDHVYVIIDLYANSLYVNVDNISFTVSGSGNSPTLSGSIAYIGLDSSGKSKTINSINPDGSGQQRIWTHPGTISPDIYDVAWNPDASELAFSSDHESIYSAFLTDVYGIQPDGSNIRRISNPPSKAALDTGSYQWGTVTGIIRNNHGGNVAPFLVYIQGAKETKSVSIGSYGDEVSFTIENVADLGSGHLPYVVFAWSDTVNANCRTFLPGAIADVLPGQTVDVGILVFDGGCIHPEAQEISWKRDGKQLAVDVATPQKFDVVGEAIGSALFNNAPVFSGAAAWSPVSDQVIYHLWSLGGTAGIYSTTAGGNAGTQLLHINNAISTHPAWLPDGSGFIYADEDTLYQYNIASSQIITLTQAPHETLSNPSVSSDGKYIVFERTTTSTPTQSNLWILNLSKPVEQWPLTSDGKSSNPNWSLKEPTTKYKIYLPTIIR